MPLYRLISSPLPLLAVGSRVWVWDDNRRAYAKRARVGSGPIFREHFAPGNIVGENRKSWIVSAEGRAVKIPKSTRLREVAYSASELRDLVYCNEHCQKVVELVRLAPPKQLQKIAALAGYVLPAVKPTKQERKDGPRDPRHSVAELVRDSSPDVFRKVVAILGHKPRPT